MQVIKGMSLGAIFMALTTVLAVSNAQATEDATQSHDLWLKNQFAEKHQDILPKVAVADMFYGCNVERKFDPIPYQVKQLIQKMDKSLLADKLQQCLGDEKVNSESALNFGLVGCFTDQLSALPKKERHEKMALVQGAISRLSREERHKSFTKCVTKQAIKYIQ